MKLAYLTTCFGTPSHTFIRRELREFQQRKVNVSLFGVRKDANIAADAGDLVEKTRYLYPINIQKFVATNLRYLFKQPRHYTRIALSCLLAPGESIKSRAKLLYHFLLSAVHAETLENQNITHLHAHFLNVSASIAMYSARLAGIPYSITLHSAGERNLPHVIGIAHKLQFAQSLLMISRFNIDYYDAIYPCKAKSHVVRCGMELDKFQYRDPLAYQKNKQQSDEDRLKILAVGRFVEKKGFHILIDAATALLNKGKRFHITIIGSGPLEAEFRTKIVQYHLGDYISLPGHASTEEVKNKMRASDVVVVPSVTSETGEMEGIPVVLMEAMISGVPVVGSAHSGIPELVSKSTGTLVAENDANALADALYDFEFDARSVAAARALIEKQFNITKVVDQRITLFAGKA